MRTSEIKLLTSIGKKFWKTKKLKMTVTVDLEARPVTLHSAYWSGGSKSDWFTVSKAGVWTALPSVGPLPYDARPVPQVAPTADVAVVEAGVFAGKIMSPHVHVISTDGWHF